MTTKRFLGSTLLLALVASACSSGAGTSSAPAATSPAASQPAASVPAAGGNAVEAKEVGALGKVLVAGSNGMTVYNFSKDTKDSGTSACTGGCLATWPALTVATVDGAKGGDGVTGKLGTITRADNGQFQVTYNGLPLYFFKNDKAPGDSNGVYENWVAVKP